MSPKDLFTFQGRMEVEHEKALKKKAKEQKEREKLEAGHKASIEAGKEIRKLVKKYLLLQRLGNLSQENADSICTRIVELEEVVNAYIDRRRS